MLIRLTEVDVYDEEEINISEFPVDDPADWNNLHQFLKGPCCVFHF